MWILFFLVILDITWYLVYSISKNNWKIPESISSCSYITKKPVLFTVWMISLAGLIMPLLLSLCNPGAWYQFLGFLISVSLGFVASSPLYKSEETVIHVIGGVSFVVFSQLFIILEGMWYITACLIPVYLGLCLYLKKKRIDEYVWWGELMTIFTLITYCLIKLI